LACPGISIGLRGLFKKLLDAFKAQLVGHFPFSGYRGYSHRYFAMQNIVFIITKQATNVKHIFCDRKYPKPHKIDISGKFGIK
jgi:hypothetical protein